MILIPNTFNQLVPTRLRPSFENVSDFLDPGFCGYTVLINYEASTRHVTVHRV